MFFYNTGNSLGTVAAYHHVLKQVKISLFT